MVKIIIKLRTTKYSEKQWEERILKNNNDDFKINEIYSINKCGKSEIRVKIEHITCGHVIDTRVSGLMHLKNNIKCPECNLKNSKISVEEWKNKIEHNDEFELLDIYYKTRKDTGRNETWVKIKHKDCGTTFNRIASGFLYNGRKCPLCSNMLSVSYLHAVVTLLFMKYYKDVEVEYDIGFKGEDGGVSKYDLYIPNYKDKPTIIEFQSRFHDTKEEFDLKKKNYAIDKGYEFIAIDHRNCSIEEAIKLFFGEIEIDLDSLDLSKFNKLDLVTAQKLLNEYKTVKEISKIMNVGEGSINSAISQKRITVPKDRRIVIYNIKKIVQLDMDGNYINIFDSCYQIEKKLKIKIMVKENSLTFSKGFVWLDEQYYLSNKYKIPDITTKQCKTFIEIDDNYNIINTYNSLKEASEILNIPEKYIRLVLKGERNITYGHKFIFLYKYYEILNRSKVS